MKLKRVAALAGAVAMVPALSGCFLVDEVTGDIRAWSIQYESTGPAQSITYTASEGGKARTDLEGDASKDPWSAAVLIERGSTPKVTVVPQGDATVSCKTVLDPDWENRVILDEKTGAPGEAVTCEGALPKTKEDRGKLK